METYLDVTWIGKKGSILRQKSAIGKCMGLAPAGNKAPHNFSLLLPWTGERTGRVIVRKLIG